MFICGRKKYKQTNIKKIIMKKLFTFLLVACFTATLFGQPTIVSTTPSNRNMILEEFTGKSCQYCPDGHKKAQQLMNQYPGRFFAINVHAGTYATGTPNYTTPYGSALLSQASVPGFPAGSVNRQVFPGVPIMNGSTNYAYDRSRWGQCANIGLAQSSCLNVAAAGTLNLDTRHLSLLVEVYYTANAVQPTNKLTVAMLQNEILGPQTGGAAYYPEMMVGSQYRHMHMLRDFVTGTQWGMDVSPTTTGSFWSHTFEYDVPQHFNNVEVVLTELEFIVFVAENQQTIISGSEANITFIGLPPISGRIDALSEIPVPDCSSDAKAFIKVKNTGQNPITSVEIKYTVAGGTPNNFVWNKRTIPSMTSDTIHLPVFQVQTNQNQIINTELVKINDTPVTSAAKSLTIKKDVVQGADSAMKLVIRTDQYGNECTFKIFKPDGTILKQGGPFDSSTVEREFDFIPVMDGCYRLEVYDTYGDGMPGGFIKILNSAGTQIYYAAGNSYSSILRANVPYYAPANFYTITATAGENGAISPAGEKEYAEGETAVYTFTPNSGYEVDEVLVDDTPVDFENNKYTFVAVDKDYTIHVTFKMLPTNYYKITATAGENGAISPDGEIEYEEGEAAEYTFIPDEGYEVDEVLVNGDTVDFENNSYTFETVDKDYTIHVTFKLIESIKDVNGVSIRITPNPMSEVLFITGMYDKLEIFSVSGQILTTVHNQKSVNVSHFSKGIYFVKIQANGQTCTFKVVK